MKKHKTLALILAVSLCMTSLGFYQSAVIVNAESIYGIDSPVVDFLTRDVVEFGSYLQNDTNGDGVVNDSDTKVPIKWQVLETNGDEVLLLSDSIIDCMPYNEKSVNTTWESSSLRKWLNNDFYNSAFSDAEKAGIKESSLTNSDNPLYNTDGGNDTKDRIFLLSYDEALDYGFNEDSSYLDQARHGKVSDYARQKNILSSIEHTAFWWLRTPGDFENCAGGVDFSGDVIDAGTEVDSAEGVRPALRISLSTVRSYVKDVEKKNVAIKDATWDTVTFGSYDGKAIVWRVLNVTGNDAFVISDRIIKNAKYNETSTAMTWKGSSIRTWLNNDFYNTAFSNEEKAMIKDTTVVNSEKPYASAKTGEDTVDKIYLLSLSEAINPAYGFSGAIKCYSDARKSYRAKTDTFGFWWLRSTGHYDTYAQYLNNYGYLSEYGTNITSEYGVRPVLHINLAASAWKKGDKISASSVKEEVIKLSSVKCKKNSTKITGKVSLKGAKVKIKVGKKAYKKAKVSGNKFTLKLSSKLAKKTKVYIKVSKTDYKTIKVKYVAK